MDVGGFGKRLKEAREAAGLSQRGLAEALKEEFQLEITASSISGYEKDKSYPTLPNAKAIAEKLNVSLDYLCGITDTMNQGNLDTFSMTYAEFFRLIMGIENLFGKDAGLDIDTDKYGEIMLDGASGYPCGHDEAAVMYFNDDIVVKFVSEWDKILDAYRQNIFDYDTYKMVMESVLNKDIYKGIIGLSGLIKEEDTHFDIDEDVPF